MTGAGTDPGRGLQGPLKRVVLYYPDDRPDDCFAFGTVDGENWYGISVEAKPGMRFDGLQGCSPGFRPMSMHTRYIRHLESRGRVEEVEA